MIMILSSRFDLVIDAHEVPVVSLLVQQTPRILCLKEMVLQTPDEPSLFQKSRFSPEMHLVSSHSHPRHLDSLIYPQFSVSVLMVSRKNCTSLPSRKTGRFSSV